MSFGYSSAASVIKTQLETEYKGLNQEETIEYLKSEVLRLRDSSSQYYATNLPCNLSFADGKGQIPEHGSNAVHCREKLVQITELDNRPRLNTSSYVNVVFEDEEKDVAIRGLKINLADGSVYPSSVKLHDQVVDAIARLWNCPEDDQIEDFQHYAGSGTVGSTEACLLALLAHKHRWRDWYAERNALGKEEVIGVIPNIVIPTHYQACWEKTFRYFDIEPRFLHPEFNKFRINPEEIRELVDEKTLMVVGIMGNHYNGTYDPIAEMDNIIGEINYENGYQVGLHVDAASGGFIAPFQDDAPVWDFRLKNVLSISSSGHKFGESACGTGWVIFRHKKGLAEHIETEVTYLGGVSYSMTLNFSRPATGVYVQAYKFLRLGMKGYRSKVHNQLTTTNNFREKIRAMKWTNGEPLFEICDPDQEPGLPVFAARVNPELGLKFDDVKLQHPIAEFHWYVSAYHLSFEDYTKGGMSGPLCKDEPADATMFRVVFKSNLTTYLADDLFRRITEIMDHVKAIESPKVTEGETKEEVRPSSIVATVRAVISVQKAMAAHDHKLSMAGEKAFINQHAAC
jgi:glutamate decarboxylase